MLPGSQALVNDPYYNNVVLLLRGYDATSGQVFKDYSKYKRTITANGNVAHSTTQKKYGNSSIYFDGSGDYLSVPASSDFAFGTGDFTIEVWVYYVPLATSHGRILCDSRPDNSNGSYWVLEIDPSGKIDFITKTIGGTTIKAPTTLPANQFVHVAITRGSGNLQLFVNGVPVASVSGNTDDISSSVLKIGGNAFRSTAPDTYWNGYQEDIRITKNIARPITVPTQPFPNW